MNSKKKHLNWNQIALFSYGVNMLELSAVNIPFRSLHFDLTY